MSKVMAPVKLVVFTLCSVFILAACDAPTLKTTSEPAYKESLKKIFDGQDSEEKRMQIARALLCVGSNGAISNSGAGSVSSIGAGGAKTDIILHALELTGTTGRLVAIAGTDSTGAYNIYSALELSGSTGRLMAVDGKNAAEIVKTGAEARKKWALDGLPPTLAPRKGAMAGVTAEQMLNAAEQWDAETQLALAGMYGAGRGLPKDAAKAAYWLEKAAEQGQAEAQYKLGDWYDTGHGVPKDGAKAAYWLEKAAAQGHAEAQYWLGLMYKFGDGVPKNKAEAAYWFKKAAAQGHAGARLNLDQINKSAK